MGQIDENTPKLKLKISSPNREDIESSLASEALAPEWVSEVIGISPITSPAVWITDPEKVENSSSFPSVEEAVTPKIKISINSIKSSHKIETPPTITIEENLEPLSNSPSSLKSAPIETISHRDVSPEKGEMRDFLSVQNKSLPINGVFKNYSSDFDRKSISFIDRVRSIGKAPKTRIGLLIWMIVISSIGIGSLMIIAPEKHSFSIYKTNILYLYQTKFGNASSLEVPLENIVQTPPDTIVLGTGETQQWGSGVSLDREEIKQQKLRDFLKSKQ